MAYDVVVIGAGLSGLVDAILLAETGRRVLVLEQHTVPGGYLQQFRRKQTVFDVGFHYVGSTLPGRPMRQLMEHLQVWHRVRLLPFPEDAAIVVRRGERTFAYPTRFDRFHERARATWPHAREEVDRIVRGVDEVCHRFKWFDLRKGRTYGHPFEVKLSPQSFQEFVSGVTDDAWLEEVLAFQTFNLGLFADEIPWTKYALAFRSNFDLTCRIDGGGGALVDALVARGRELGVDYRFRSEVITYSCEGRFLRSVATADGGRFAADLFVAACPPKVVLQQIPDEAVHPKYKEPVLRLKDSRGALQVFVRLKQPLRSLEGSCLLLHDDAEAAHPELPLPTVLVTHPTNESVERGGPRLEAMTYLGQEPFARWRDRPVLRRGEDYEALKRALARRMIGMIARVAPELPDLVEDTYVATPLTDEWYTKNTGGGVFGISHDVTQQGRDRPRARMRLKNLWFTGHSITMPGICGVFVNAFDTCGAIRGDDALFEAVAT